MKKTILYLILVFVLCSFVSAVTLDIGLDLEELPTLKVGNSVITIPCRIDSEPCSNNTNCNISIFDYGTTLVNSANMSYNYGFFNYSVDLKEGDYRALVFCSDSFNSDTAHFNMEVTNSGGKVLDKTDLLLALGLICAILLTVAIFINEEKLYPLKLILAVIVLFIGLSIIPAVLVYDRVAIFLYQFVTVIMWLVFAGVMILIIWLLFKKIKEALI